MVVNKREKDDNIDKKENSKSNEQKGKGKRNGIFMDDYQC